MKGSSIMKGRKQPQDRIGHSVEGGFGVVAVNDAIRYQMDRFQRTAMPFRIHEKSTREIGPLNQYPDQTHIKFNQPHLIMHVTWCSGAGVRTCSVDDARIEIAIPIQFTSTTYVIL